MVGIIVRRVSSCGGCHFLESSFCLFYFHFCELIQNCPKLSKTVQIFKTVRNCPWVHHAGGRDLCTPENPELHGRQQRRSHFARVSSVANKLTRNYDFFIQMCLWNIAAGHSYAARGSGQFWTVLDLALDSFEILKIPQNPQLRQPLQNEPRQLRKNCSERLCAGTRSTEQCCRRYRPPLESPRK